MEKLQFIFNLLITVLMALYMLEMKDRLKHEFKSSVTFAFFVISGTILMLNYLLK